MRHAKDTFKVGRTGAHCRAMMANMVKSLIIHNRIETTIVKAKELKRYADRMITLAKRDTLASRRRIIADLRICFNTLTPKEARKVKAKDLTSYNRDRCVLNQLCGELKERFKKREGGYTRILKLSSFRVGDNAPKCIIEYLE